MNTHNAATVTGRNAWIRNFQPQQQISACRPGPGKSWPLAPHGSESKTRRPAPHQKKALTHKTQPIHRKSATTRENCFAHHAHAASVPMPPPVSAQLPRECSRSWKSCPGPECPAATWPAGPPLQEARTRHHPRTRCERRQVQVPEKSCCKRVEVLQAEAAGNTPKVMTGGMEVSQMCFFFRCVRALKMAASVSDTCTEYHDVVGRWPSLSDHSPSHTFAARNHDL